MPLTDAQTTGLEAAILAYLTAEGGCFARTAAAFKQDVGDDLFVVSDCVLKYIVSRGNKTSVDKKTLEAMVLSYLNSMAEGRFTRTVAAFKEEALIDGDGEETKPPPTVRLLFTMLRDMAISMPSSSSSATEPSSTLEMAKV